ncbi:cytidine deaminase isoform X1 [Ixodes scapularis]|uniref:cytidine deaminase isoform X1 n=1 Tax=Ixodes scapularis TaxID=6945 RepID=UPI001A9CBCDE|nr:cytidine deaminase isoform X1 [Ixodes scapularis]
MNYSSKRKKKTCANDFYGTESNNQTCVLDMDDKTVQKLVHLSQEVRANAYCPYSQVQVGAALLCEDGTIYTGCNVENASYGLTICAERTAIVKAVSEGRRYFKAMAVASNMKDFTMPCGNCRQFILEFGPDIVVYAVGNSGQVLAKRVDELLPFAFTGSDLPAK